MVRALGEVLGADDRVLVIDDNSPDGTGEHRRPARGRARRTSTSSTARARRGSAPPTSTGFRRALADGAELVLEMDCDFSHDPADVPRLIAAAEEPTSCSARATSAGGGVANWGLVRRSISRGRLALRAGACSASRSAT